jgi:hypothetical protein
MAADMPATELLVCWPGSLSARVDGVMQISSLRQRMKTVMTCSVLPATIADDMCRR